MKKLPLTAIFAFLDTKELTDEIKELSTHYELTEPTIGINGIYLNNGKGWAEIDGIAIVVAKSDFNYALESYNYNERPLRDIEFRTLDTLYNVNSKLLQGTASNKYHKEVHRRQLRENTKEIFKFMFD